MRDEEGLSVVEGVVASGTALSAVAATPPVIPPAPIPVASTWPRVVRLRRVIAGEVHEGACSLRVRRLRRTVDARLQIAAGIGAEASGSAGREEVYRHLQARWAVMVAINLTDAETGEAVALRPIVDDAMERDNGYAFGPMMPERLVDVLSGEDLTLVWLVAVLGLEPDNAERIVRMSGEARRAALARVIADKSAGREDVTGEQEKN